MLLGYTNISAFLGLTWILAQTIICNADSNQRDVVKPTNEGYVLGKEIKLPDSSTVLAFLGIPFAEPPVGSFRFQPPMDKKKWNGILNATQFGNICYQPEVIRLWIPIENEFGQRELRLTLLKSIPMSEDCLSLNVYIPKAHADFGSLPVLVYVHGGSYGINSGQFYPGEELASKGVIVVTFNYRLGPFGFFSTGDDAAMGNYGMLDQLHAFKWVKKNIGNFGGDPNKMTIFGNSAGGSSVSLHLVSPLATDLFSAVIAQSGSSLAPWAIQRKPNFWATTLGQQTGCPIGSNKQLVDCLRGVSASEINRLSTKANGLLIPYAPVIDGHYLPDDPESLMSSGRFLKIPFLTGITRNEAAFWYKSLGQEIAMSDVINAIKQDVVLLLQSSDVSELNHVALLHVILAQYFYKKGSTDLKEKVSTQNLIDFMSDVVFKASCIKLIQNMSNNNSTAPIYVYEFAYYSSDDRKLGESPWVGTYHESELQYLLGFPFLNFTNTLRLENDKSVSELMMELWINFAKYGNPTPPNRNPLDFYWEPYTGKHQTYLEITEDPIMKKDYLIENSIFWNSFVPIFSDYSIQFEQNSSNNVSNDWLIWFLTALVCVMCILLVICLVRHRSSSTL